MKQTRSTHFEKVQRKRYAERAFRNPLFPTKEPARWPKIVLAVLVFAALVGAAVALCILPIFAISAVHVSGNETIATADLVTAINQNLNTPVLFFFRRSNRFLFNQTQLQQTLQQTFSLASVTMEREGSTLNVEVHEQASGLLWKSGSIIFLVDTSGKVIRPLTSDEISGLTQADPPLNLDGTLAPETRLKRLPLFVDINTAPVTVGASVLTPAEVAGVTTFEQQLLDQKILFTETDVDRLSGEWMAVKTLVGYQILFDPLNDVLGQTTRLATLLHDQVQDPKGLSYIDLRFGDHVYYK